MLKHIFRISEEIDLKTVAQETAHKLIESKAAAATVVAGTATMALTNIDSMISLVAKGAAATLSIVLAIKHGYDVVREYKKAKREDEKNTPYPKLEEDI